MTIQGALPKVVAASSMLSLDVDLWMLVMLLRCYWLRTSNYHLRFVREHKSYVTRPLVVTITYY